MYIATDLHRKLCLNMLKSLQTYREENGQMLETAIGDVQSKWVYDGSYGRNDATSAGHKDSATLLALLKHNTSSIRFGHDRGI
jgi:hypothetical protein